ncbi:ClbS/DfsB family four-helix bundle protein [Microbacterium sp. SS28]|uniref:ClbS/DfsB family four-helix bundle protein n=1 Tax=Microbacterium sp. SS28 TaxID=2919948 RepID=UPI001FAA6598|nr:ClbS/DfsB family four-helix bundle protein [Microbacterium sp. SS28]
MATEQRDALIQSNADEYARLKSAVQRLRDAGRIDEAFAGESRDRCVRDVLAHLLAWHLLLEGWYEEGMIGGAPALPADGFTWKQLDALNVVLRDRWQDTLIEDVERRLDASHSGLQRLIATHSDEELFDGAVYSWTRGSKLGEFCRECGGSHYSWALETIAAGLPEERHP